MDKILDKLNQTKVETLLIAAGLALLLASVLDLTDFGNTNVDVADELSVVRLTGIGIGLLLLALGIGIHLKQPHGRAPETDGAAVLDVQGKTIVFTGTLNLERDVLVKQAGRLGATITNQVTGNTDYLIAGTKPGANKIKAATRYEVPIVSAEQWYATVNRLSR